MLGIVPAAGAGSRLQPLAFSKELLPVASGGIGRAKAVAEFVVDRMLAAVLPQERGEMYNCWCEASSPASYPQHDPLYSKGSKQRR